MIALATIVASVVAWVTFSSIDHSLWLEAERLDDTTALGKARDTSNDDLLTLLVRIDHADADHLAPGIAVYVNQTGVADSTVRASIEHIAPISEANPPGTRTIALRVPREPSDRPGRPSRDANYRLRIPVGTQSPLKTLIGLGTGAQRSTVPDSDSGRPRRTGI